MIICWVVLKITQMFFYKTITKVIVVTSFCLSFFQENMTKQNL